MTHEVMIDGEELLRLLGGVGTVSTFEGVNMVRQSSVLELVRRRVDEARATLPAAEPADAGRDAVAYFDRAVADELPRVSHVEYDSHEICKHFAEKVRERMAALASQQAVKP